MCDKGIRTFKLIDRDGFIESYDGNEKLLEMFEIKGNIKGVIKSDGELDVSNGTMCHISRGELDMFFEEVFPIPLKQSPTLWDGIAPLEVGMVVKESRFGLVEVMMLHEDQVVIKHDNVLSTALVGKLQTAKKSHKDETLEKVMKAWKGQGIDFVYDDVNSRVGIKRLFEVVYEVLLKDEDMKSEEN